MRKRNTTLACALMLLMSMFLIPADVGAQIKWQEDFNYPIGNLYAMADGESMVLILTILYR